MESLYSRSSSKQADKEYQKLVGEFGNQIEEKAKKLNLGMSTRQMESK